MSQADVTGDFLAVRADDVAPIPISTGIDIRILWRDGARFAAVLDMAPGTVWPNVDEHVGGAEEVFVVSGEFCDGAQTYGAGTFIHGPPGSTHRPQTATGCRLFLFYPEGLDLARP